MKNMVDAQSENVESKTLSSHGHDVNVFFCYRRNDGAWHAEWLNQNLSNIEYAEPEGTSGRIVTYYDKTAPGVADWKKLHFPSLQTSQALILICTPGIAKDFSKRGHPDWVYEELRWWCRHRSIAPIVIDATGEGDRWLPEMITRKWPDINRIELIRDSAETAERAGNSSFAARVCERVIGAIRESQHATVFQDLERFRKLNKRLVLALTSALFLLLAAIVASLLAINLSQVAGEERNIALSRELSMRAISQLSVDPERSLLIAIEAARISPTSETEDALRKALRDSRIRVQLFGHQGDVIGTIFSPDGKYVVTASRDATARIWEVATGETVADLRGHTSEVMSATFSPDGKYVVTASSDTTARIWEVTTGKTITDLRGHAGEVMSATFSPDGKYVVTGSLDATARIWEVPSWKSLSVVLRGHTDSIVSAAYSPDGNYVVTASTDGTAKVWEAKTGMHLMELRGHSGSVVSATFSPDGKHIVTAGKDGTARIFICELCGSLEDLNNLARTRVTRTLSREERIEFLHETAHD